MSDVRKHNLKRLAEHLRCIDAVTIAVLKVHLLLEEQLEHIPYPTSVVFPDL